MGYSENLTRNHRSTNAPSGEMKKWTGSECRIQGHSSGRAGGISHQGRSQGARENGRHEVMDHHEPIQ
jgi:hypothetical protein